MDSNKQHKCRKNWEKGRRGESRGRGVKAGCYGGIIYDRKASMKFYQLGKQMNANICETLVLIQLYQKRLRVATPPPLPQGNEGSQVWRQKSQ